LLKFDRPCYPEPEKARSLYDFGPTKITRPTSSINKLGTQIDKFTPNLSRQGCPPKYTLGSFKIWGSSYLETYKKFVRSCSPELTNLNSHMDSAFATTTKCSLTWQKPNINIQSKPFH